jgi:hypothetical protein
MIRIGIADSHPQNACSYYRGFGPLMKIKELSLRSLDLKNINWLDMNNIDLVYMGRPDNPDFIKLIELCQTMHIPVWMDWDDDILALPSYNPAYKHFESMKNTIKKAISMVDIVTVSTPALVESFKDLNNNIEVIPNAWNDFNFPMQKKDNNNESILWRGSDTHRDDLLEVLEPMAKVSKNFVNWLFMFIGSNVWYITNYLQKAHNVDGLHMLHYMKLLAESKAAVFQAPLVDNKFNRSKSNISWLEATFSGAAFIGPDLPEFNRPGIVKYNSLEKYQYNLEKLLNSKEYRQKKYKESFDYIQENLLLSKVNEKRKEIIEKCL